MTLNFDGSAPYLPEYPRGQHQLLVGVSCAVDGLQCVALLDTAAEWCVLSRELVHTLEYSLSAEAGTALLHCRQGLLRGRLERLPVTLLADTGVDVQLEATFFLSSEWRGPVVLGWRGCLERVRFALDPFSEVFYFAGD